MGCVPCFALYTPNPRNRIRNFIDFSRLVVGVEASSGSRASGARDIRAHKNNYIPGIFVLVPCFALYTPNPRNRIRNFIDFSRLVVGVEASSGSRASGARDIRRQLNLKVKGEIRERCPIGSRLLYLTEKGSFE
nr:hypothetical protein CFP56_48170 [Quercus suber]